MLDFLIYLLGLTLLTIILNICIRVFVIKPGQISKIEHFIEDGKLKEALIYVTLCLKRHPKNAVFGYWQGELLWQLGSKGASVEAFEGLNLSHFKSMPSYYAHILFRLGSWYCEQDDLAQSSSYFSTLFKTKVENPEYFYGGSLLALKENNPHHAIKLLHSALHLDNSMTEALILLGDTYNKLESYPEAYSAYARLVQLHPDKAEIWLKLADTSFKGGNTAKAVKFFNKAESFPNPELRFKAVLGLFQVYKTTGEIFQGIQALSKAISYSKPEFCPQDTLLELHYELAELHIAVEEVEQAIRQWEIILKIDPLYKDVSVKYAEFSQLRLSDLFKDLLTLNGSRLVETVIKFIQGMGLTVDSYNLIPDGTVDVITVESLGKWRDSRKVKSMFSFWCSSEPVPLYYVDELKLRQNTSGAYRALLISAGPALSETRQFLSRRSIDFYNADNISLLSSTVKNPALMEDALEP